MIGMQRFDEWVRTDVKVRWPLMIAAVLSLALGISGLPAMAAEGGRLVVTGEAEVKMAPDSAIFQIGVETRAQTLEEAREANAAAMKRVQDRLIAAGADPKTLQTQGFNVQPEWRYDEESHSRVLVGYWVTHTLTVTVTDLAQLGALLDAAMAEGANRVYGPTFAVRDTEALEAEALKEAVRKARAKAQVLAEASGTFLKGIVEIRESVSAPYAPYARAAYAALDAAESVTTSIAPGEVTISASVTITFEI